MSLFLLIHWTDGQPDFHIFDSLPKAQSFIDGETTDECHYFVFEAIPILRQGC